KQVLKGDNETTGGTDLAINPEDPQEMYAAMWDHLREPDKRRYNGTGSGVYRSSDGGTTWSRVNQPGLMSSPALGRIGIAYAPSAPDTIFIITSGEGGAGLGLYKSTNGGTTFLPLSDPSINANSVVYGWWFGRIWVDPKDANHVFTAGLALAESKNGGLTFSLNTDPHADEHALAWDPKEPNRVYLGNDGGVYRSEDNGSNFTFAKHQPFSQLYGLDVGEQDPSRLVAGLQDNGVVRSYGAKDGKWNSYGGGDGERTLINPRNQDIVYGCSQYGECFVSKSGGSSPKSSFTNEVVSSRKNWFTPIEFDPEDPKTIYTGGEIMSRSDNDAGDFRTISPDLSNGPGRETNPLFRNFGTLTTIAPAPKRTGIIYAGTDDGNLWYTRNGGGAWTKASDPDLPKAWVTRVEVDKTNPDVAYVTYSGFRQQEDSAYLLRTTDGGKSWEDIGAGLPRAPLNDVNAIGDKLVVASDTGVFLSRDAGGSWLRLGEGLPIVPVFELRYHAPTDSLYAGTFGRGIYRVAMPGAAEDNAAGTPANPGAAAGAGAGGKGSGGPAAKGKERARVRIVSRRFVAKGRRAKIRLACLAGPSCQGYLRLKLGKATLARVRFSVPAGTSRTLKVRLARSNVRRLKARRRTPVVARAGLVGERLAASRRLRRF
ncbi:MAG: GH74, partial [uncultured Solirubrobacteraceae bacterium]